MSEVLISPAPISTDFIVPSTMSAEAIVAAALARSSGEEIKAPETKASATRIAAN
jgi:hypothetical protein